MDSKELRTNFDIGNGITLRAWTESDVQIAFDVVMHEREHLRTFMRWMTDDYSIESSVKFISEGIANRNERKNLGLGIFRGTELIGSIGFVYFDWEDRRTEIGYWIARGEEGKGIITSATKRLIEYAFEELNFNRVEIRCSAENSRSAAVPVRLGFQLEGTLRKAEFLHGRPHDFHIYGLLAEDPRLW